MKILLTLHAALDINAGAASVLLRLKAEFERRGHHVEMLSYDDLPTFARRFGEIALALLVAWRMALRYRHFDVIDTSSGDACLAFLLPRGRRRQLRVVHSHGLHALMVVHEQAQAAQRKIPLQKRLWRYGLRLRQVSLSHRHADLALVLNDAERAVMVADGVASTHIRRIRLGMGLPVLEDPPQRAAGGFAIVQLGSYTTRKGREFTARAMSAILKAYPQATMTFAGTGVGRDTVLADYDRALADRISVIPSYGNAELCGILQGKSALLMPSLFEGYGIAKIEAMARGVVPVVSDDPGTATDMVHEGNALVVPTGDADALAAAIRRLIGEPDLLERLARNGLATARAANWSDVAEERLQIYREFLSGITTAA
jgi:glycosyltransferase involved in cell wall biosynthesis